MRLCFFIILFVFSFNVHAEDIFDRVGDKNGFDANLLRAIALQESNLEPFALNCKGKGFYPKSKQEAMRIFRSYGLICDVGFMQVNYTWNGLRQNVSVDDLFEPIKNIEAAIKIIRENMSGTKNVWQAVGRYHTWKDKKRSIRYAWSVHDRYMKMSYREVNVAAINR